MSICEKCGKSVSDYKLKKVAVKRGKQTVILNVCKECWNKEV